MHWSDNTFINLDKCIKTTIAQYQNFCQIFWKEIWGDTTVRSESIYDQTVLSTTIPTRTLIIIRCCILKTRSTQCHPAPTSIKIQCPRDKYTCTCNITKYLNTLFSVFLFWLYMDYVSDTLIYSWIGLSVKITCYLLSATCAAMIFWRSTTRRQFGQWQSFQRQNRLCPFKQDTTPWFRHLAHLGVLGGFSPSLGIGLLCSIAIQYPTE